MQIKTIIDDYKHFDIKYDIKIFKRTLKLQIKKFNEIDDLKSLFKMKSFDDYENSNYNNKYPAIQGILIEFMDIDLMKIVDIDKYEMFLFINLLNNSNNINIEFGDNHIEKYKDYYDKIFKPYFINKYRKEEANIITDKMNSFENTYSDIFGSTKRIINKNKIYSPEEIEHNKKYDREAKHKSSLKKIYKRILNGEDVMDTNQQRSSYQYQIKMIEFIINNRIHKKDK